MHNIVQTNCGGAVSMVAKSRKNRPDISYRVEKIILKAVIIGVLLLISFQAIMLNETARVFLNYATRLEGGSMEESGIISPEGKLVLRLENLDKYPQALLLVNGEPVASFENAEIEVNIRNNDLIEIDATKVDDDYLYISIVGVSDNVISPSIGYRVKARNKIQLFSRVKLK
ncbi:MAG: hypothetical protein QME73_08990 [Bacillota bacterium]|nr:hypothetical protein [Bacillota bacterium]